MRRRRVAIPIGENIYRYRIHSFIHFLVEVSLPIEPPLRTPVALLIGLRSKPTRSPVRTAHTSINPAVCGWSVLQRRIYSSIYTRARPSDVSSIASRVGVCVRARRRVCVRARVECVCVQSVCACVQRGAPACPIYGIGNGRICSIGTGPRCTLDSDPIYSIGTGPIYGIGNTHTPSAFTALRRAALPPIYSTRAYSAV